MAVVKTGLHQVTVAVVELRRPVAPGPAAGRGRLVDSCGCRVTFGAAAVKLVLLKDDGKLVGCHQGHVTVVACVCKTLSKQHVSTHFFAHLIIMV